MTATPARLAVFASGGGSNLQAIIDHLHSLGAHAPAVLALVVSDRVSAGALARARAAEVPAVWVAKDRSHELSGILERHAVTHIALAGYLRLVPASVTTAYRSRIVNVHPALLPAFGGSGMYGHHVHEAVIKRGARVSGPTVHFVDAHYDEGPIIAQWPVPVLEHDTPESLAARVLRAEHALFPRCIEALCAARITLGDDGRVVGADALASPQLPA